MVCNFARTNSSINCTPWLDLLTVPLPTHAGNISIPAGSGSAGAGRRPDRWDGDRTGPDGEPAGGSGDLGRGGGAGRSGGGRAGRTRPGDGRAAGDSEPARGTVA